MTMIKNFGDKGFFLLLGLLIISIDIVILLNIPFLRQIIGFLFLSILLEVLILKILNLNKLDLTEKFTLSVGLSISFLMLFGLLINNLSLALGYETPLATIPLLISFNLAFVVLAIVGETINKTQAFSFPNLNLTTQEKAFLILPIIFPALSIVGMHIMNITDNNNILMLLLFLIPIYVAFVYFFNQKFPERLYPVVIFLISISLLLLLALRSNHILGCDTHQEYYLFQTTLDNLHWRIFVLGNALDACLSISILPTIYHSILNVNEEYLFKILYSVIYSILPLVVYVISKKYVGASYGFLASFFFMSQCIFLETSANSRTSIAILFFALAMMTLFSDKIDPLKKRILFIVFMASCMVSHYSTTYLFFFILLGTFVGLEILSKKYTFKKIISITIVILFFAFIFFWYSQVTETAFTAGVDFIENTFSNLNSFFVEESRAPAFKSLAGQEWEYPILSRANWVVTWCTFIYIGIGVLTMIKRYKEMIDISNVNQKKPDFLKTKFGVDYLTIVLVCSGLLVIMIVLPYVSRGYDVWRLYSLVTVILSVCFIMGGIILSKHFFFFTKRKPVLKEKQKTLIKKQKEGGVGERWKEKEKASQARAYLVILLILIPYSMFGSGVMHQIFGVSESIILNSEGTYYDAHYVHDQESCGAKWLKGYNKDNTRIYATDAYVGTLRLMSQGIISRGLIDATSLQKDRKIEGYIYLGYYNVVEGKLFGVEPNSCNLSDYSHQFVGKSKIYANGGAEVYR